MAQLKYKLIYFDLTGLGEPIRWMFAHRNVPFEDHRIRELPSFIVHEPTPEWDALKPKTPFGTIPVLQIAGNEEYLGESTAIARFVAREIGLEGKNNWEAAQADSIINYLTSEFHTVVWDFGRELDPAKKAVKRDKILAVAPKVAEKLETILEKNSKNGGKGFFVGSTPTVADFVGVSFLTAVTIADPGSDVTSKYKLLTAHRDLIRGLPGVKEFIEKHAEQTRQQETKLLTALHKSSSFF